VLKSPCTINVPAFQQYRLRQNEAHH
jgi:hypothetical protein